MNIKKLTREEIALSLLNGILGGVEAFGGGQRKLERYLFNLNGNVHSFQDSFMSHCELAFRMADIFILERDKQLFTEERDRQILLKQANGSSLIEDGPVGLEYQPGPEEVGSGQRLESSHIKRIWVSCRAWSDVSYSAQIAARYRDFCQEIFDGGSFILGMQREEVLHHLGRPTAVLGEIEVEPCPHQRVFDVDGPTDGQNHIPEGTTIDNYNEWNYRHRHSGYLNFKFDSAGVVESLFWYCDGTPPIGWGPIAGIRYGDPEEKLLILGTPTFSSPVDINNDCKQVEFLDIGLSFEIAKERVYACCLVRPSKREGARILRFLRTLQRSVLKTSQT